eukprot:TRINITY_DN36170_c0_g1_i1.p1 TRINITY_DN36170_c0_g1~~TRINITY_DN36170_c0_g1_i1.p1  ORF type:complete len:287 (+),score=-6.70 TRINITY_DN36170_c0_g1_i1:59-862(+)
MEKTMALALILLFVVLGQWQAAAQSESCPKEFEAKATGSGQAKKFEQCKALATLGATLSYTTGSKKGELEIAYRAKPAASGGWVAWGVNPKAPMMMGSQILLAYVNANGKAHVDTYHLTNVSGPFAPTKDTPDLQASNTTAVSDGSTGHISIFATVTLSSPLSKVNMVWQVGSKMNGVSPQPHAFAAPNLKSNATFDFSLASSSTSSPAGAPSSSVAPLGAPANAKAPAKGASKLSPQSSHSAALGAFSGLTRLCACLVVLTSVVVF